MRALLDHLKRQSQRITEILDCPGLDEEKARRLFEPPSSIPTPSAQTRLILAAMDESRGDESLSDEDRVHLLQHLLNQSQKCNEGERSMLRVLAHELRSPLVTVKGYVELMARGKLGPLVSIQQKSMDVALRNTVLLENRIQNALYHARGLSAPLMLTLQKTALSPLFHKVTEHLHEIAARKGTSLKVDLPDETWAVQANPETLQCVLYNLLNNALEHTSGGLILLAASLEEGKIKIRVDDSGDGIEAQYLQDIFKPFFAVPGSAKSRGLGLGLSVSKKIIRAHKSRIEVESEPGKGSSFSFLLERA